MATHHNHARSSVAFHESIEYRPLGMLGRAISLCFKERTTRAPLCDEVASLVGLHRN